MSIKMALTSDQYIFPLPAKSLNQGEISPSECDLPLSTSIRDGGHILRARRVMESLAGKVIKEEGLWKRGV